MIVRVIRGLFISRGGFFFFIGSVSSSTAQVVRWVVDLYSVIQVRGFRVYFCRLSSDGFG